jgi:cytidyltransferase-like protein
MIERSRPSELRTRVYVDMVGDLFHMGHVEFLRSARAFGDWLVAGVLSDEVVASYKRMRIMTLAERVAVIAACRYRRLRSSVACTSTRDVAVEV